MGKIVRLYREALKEKGIQRAYDFLVREGAVQHYNYLQEYPKVQWRIGDTCLVCGKEVSIPQVLNHFRQTHSKVQDHWAYVDRYYAELKEVFLEIIENRGYDLVNEDTIYGEAIWVEAARGSHPQMGNHITPKNDKKQHTKQEQ